jgi:hypothetical protein
MNHSMLPEYLMPYVRYIALGGPVCALFLSKLFFPRNKAAQILLSSAATVLAIRTMIGPQLDQMTAQMTSLSGFLGH